MRHFRASLASLPLLAQPIGALPVGTWSAGLAARAGRARLQRRPAGARPGWPMHDFEGLQASCCRVSKHAGQCRACNFLLCRNVLQLGVPMTSKKDSSLNALS